ncbi:MAG: deoxyguanosinetriphosphate triphosphohydrolase [Bacillota bacterium]
MTDRERLEQEEERMLAPQATKSRASRGRIHPEPPCPRRTAFQLDRERIVHAKAFRRLGHKTQVFLSPEGDHYRTRLTHTLEVAQVARTIARLLRLNEDLTEAIALGHDLGHTPFGHAGEAALDRLLPGGFRHNEQSLRVVDRLERIRDDFSGLNLTWEVRDGLLHHTGPVEPATWEGRVVRLADRIAYLNHDIDDAVRGGLLRPEELPAEVRRVLGDSAQERLETWIADVVESTRKTGRVGQGPEVAAATERLREFLFARVYVGSAAKKEEAKVGLMIEVLYAHLLAHPAEIPPHYRDETDLARGVGDYIAGMTDRFAVAEFNRLFVPSCWPVEWEEGR